MKVFRTCIFLIPLKHDSLYNTDAHVTQIRQRQTDSDPGRLEAILVDEHKNINIPTLWHNQEPADTSLLPS